LPLNTLEKRREYAREKAQKAKQHYETHRELYAKRFKAYYANKSTIINAKRRAKRAANPEEARKKDRDYYAQHRELLTAKKRVVNKKNRKQRAHYDTRRRAKQAAAKINDFTYAQWQEIKQVWRYRCAYCGKKTAILTRDHIIPLSKGGNHTVSNIVPACGSCNSRKHTGPPLKTIQPLLLTIATSRETREKKHYPPTV
jgi:5-methylcytosine-specific restriction endonuclease McrA